MQSVFQARRLGKSTFPRSILPFQGDSATWTLATNSSTELYNSKILNMFEHDSKQLFGHAELSLFTWRFSQIVLIVLCCFFFLCLQGHHKHNVQSPAANLDAARVQAICSSGLQLHGEFLHRFSDSAFSQFISIYSISYLASVVTWKLVKVQLPRMFLHVWRNRCPDERTEWRLKPSYQMLSDIIRCSSVLSSGSLAILSQLQFWLWQIGCRHSLPSPSEIRIPGLQTKENPKPMCKMWDMPAPDSVKNIAGLGFNNIHQSDTNRFCRATFWRQISNT